MIKQIWVIACQLKEEIYLRHASSDEAIGFMFAPYYLVCTSRPELQDRLARLQKGGCVNYKVSEVNVSSYALPSPIPATPVPANEPLPVDAASVGGGTN